MQRVSEEADTDAYIQFAWPNACLTNTKAFITHQKQAHAGASINFFWFFTYTDGYITAAEILFLRQYKQYKEEDVTRVVDTCPLQRFTLRRDPQSGQLQIRANFGHSMQVGFHKVSGTPPPPVAHDDV